MSTLNNAEAVQNVTRTSQIIVAALAGGLLFFMSLLPFLADDAEADRAVIAGLPLLTVMALGFGGVALVLSFLVPGVMVGSGLKQVAQRPPGENAPTDPWKEGPSLPANDVGALLALFQTQLIVGSALLEGAGFFAMLAYMIEGHKLPLVVAVVLIALLLSRIPSIDRVQSWLDDQSARLANLRRGDA